MKVLVLMFLKSGSRRRPKLAHTFRAHAWGRPRLVWASDPRRAFESGSPGCRATRLPRAGPWARTGGAFNPSTDRCRGAWCSGRTRAGLFQFCDRRWEFGGHRGRWSTTSWRSLYGSLPRGSHHPGDVSRPRLGRFVGVPQGDLVAVPARLRNNGRWHFG